MLFKWKFDNFFIHFDKKTKGEKKVFSLKYIQKSNVIKKKNLGFSIWIYVFGFSRCNELIIYFPNPLYQIFKNNFIFSEFSFTSITFSLSKYVLVCSGDLHEAGFWLSRSWTFTLSKDLEKPCKVVARHSKTTEFHEKLQIKTYLFEFCLNLLPGTILYKLKFGKSQKQISSKKNWKKFFSKPTLFEYLATRAELLFMFIIWKI